MKRPTPESAWAALHRLAGPLVLLAVLSIAGCARKPTGPNDNTWLLFPGRVEPLKVESFWGGRQCWVYLPPGYSATSQRYPVLYVNDGEYAFDGDHGLHINRILEGAIRRGEVVPLIVVAISSGGPQSRYYDYTPWPDTYRFPTGGGERYLVAIRDTLKPEIDRRYRTLNDGFDTAIMGESLGGLISVYAGFAHPGTFGRVAGFSPSYWWGGDSICNYIGRLGHPKGLVRFYQDTGGPDDNDIGCVEYAVSVWFTLGVDFMSVTLEGGDHDTAAWEHRCLTMLRFLFGPDSMVRPKSY